MPGKGVGTTVAPVCCASGKRACARASRSKRRASLVAIAVCGLFGTALLAPGAALASSCTNEWKNAVSGSWSEAANWSQGRVPEPTDEVCIRKSGTYTVTLEPTISATETVKALTLGGTSGTQTLAVVANSAAGSTTLEAEKIGVEAHGAITLTSSGSAYSTTLSGAVSDHGRITTEAGAGGARSLRGSLVNNGTIVASGVPLSVPSSVTFIQAAGTTSGSEPAVVLEGGELAYAGTGASTISARGTANAVSGNVGSGQKLIVEGSCTNGSAEITPEASFTNAGRITLTNGCSVASFAATLALGSATLTNSGTIAVEAGAAGTGSRNIFGGVDNEGTVSVANEMVLPVGSGSVLRDDTGGTIAGPASGGVRVRSGGTFIQGSGKMTGAEPVVIEGGELAYAGTAETTIYARGTSNAVGGNVGVAQKLVVEGSCTNGNAEITPEFSFTNEGTIALTNGCSVANFGAALALGSATLTNSGTIAVEAGATGAGLRNIFGGVDNKGTVSVADGITLPLESGSVLRDDTGGTIAGPASGGLRVRSGGTFIQGAGTMTGAEPVVIEGGELAYAGPGASTIYARGTSSTVGGNVGAAQKLVVEGSCANGSAEITPEFSFTNEGTIALTNGCSVANFAAALTLGSATLTNNGTIAVEAGATGTGERTINGTISNNRTLSIDEGIALALSGSYSQSKAGKLRTEIGGTSSVGSLSVGGAATLAGTLEVAQVNSFSASEGEKFPILTASSRSGSFESVKGARISQTLFYAPILTATGVTLEATEDIAESLPVNTSPPTISGTAKQGQTLVLAHGTWTNDVREYADQWLRCNASGTACQPIAGAADQSYLLSGADAGHTIRVQEFAYNTGGESAPAQSSATAVIAALELKAIAGENISGTEGAPVTLDGSASTPASEITNYRWQFGDGESEEGAGHAVVHHVYKHASPAGKPYVATLTVYHGAQHSEPSSIDVTVGTPPVPSEAVTVTVKDTGQSPIEGAEVLFVGPGGTRIQGVTDASGTALLGGLPLGTDTVYVYKEGFRASSAHASVDEHHHGSASVTLSAGEVATTTLSSHEMTLAEIEAAGIDPNDPANNNVYDFEVRLAFFEASIPDIKATGFVNEAGEFVGGGGGGGGGGIDISGGGGGGGGWDCTATECESTDSPPGTPSYRIVAVPQVVEGHPLIQWLIFKGKASMLKQFFEVSMVIQNLSEEPFNLTAGTAELNLPAGLSLAPTANPQSASVPVAAIPGGGSATTNWVVRGDEEGEFRVSADYKSRLEPFNAPLDIQAALAKPLHVWGKSALKLKVWADERALEEGVPYHVCFALENVANVPLYNVGIEIESTTHANFLFQPRQQFKETVGELKPEHTTPCAVRYIVLPDADSAGKFNAPLSTASFAGDTPVPGEGIETILEPPRLYKDEALNDTPNRVHLHWEPVAEAEGYEVFSSPDLDKTPFADTPDAASATAGGAFTSEPLPATATDAYLPGNGTRHYVVTAIVKEVPTVESPAVLATAAPGNQPPEFGSCAKVAKGKGKYKTATCTSLQTGGSFEWTAGSTTSFTTKIKPATTTTTTLETKTKKKVVCTSEASGGALEGTKAIKSVVLTFTGCESSGAKCKTEAAASEGEIVTSSLEGTLGWQLKTAELKTTKVAISLFPAGHSGLVAKFKCGATQWEVRGAVLAPVAIDKMASTATLKFSETGGKQVPERFEKGPLEVLEASVGGEAFAQTGLKLTSVQTSLEAFEVNAFT